MNKSFMEEYRVPTPNCFTYVFSVVLCVSHFEMFFSWPYKIAKKLSDFREIEYLHQVSMIFKIKK